MRIIVTGGGGFIGWHLVDLLSRSGHTVQAWLRRAGEEWQGAVQGVAVDITNSAAVSDHLIQFAPDVVVHLAAQSLPGQSWDAPASTYEVNVVGALHLLEAARKLPKLPRLLIAGSSAEYAEPAGGRPISETDPTEPNSPYAASKLAVDALAQLYQRRYGLDLIRFRPFYLIGPRKIGDVCSDFARQIVAIERAESAVMRVGALDVVRDFIDIRDGVAGIARIMEAGRSGELYNVSGGTGVSIRHVLEILRSLAHKPVEIAQDPALVRPLDQNVKIGDNSRLRALGWEPGVTLEESLRTILDYWREKA